MRARYEKERDYLRSASVRARDMRLQKSAKVPPVRVSSSLMRRFRQPYLQLPYAMP